MKLWLLDTYLIFALNIEQHPVTQDRISAWLPKNTFPKKPRFDLDSCHKVAHIIHDFKALN